MRIKKSELSKEKFIVLNTVLQIDTPELEQNQLTTGWPLWGPDNKYGSFVYELYRSTTYLKSCVDFTASECTKDVWLQAIIRSLIVYGGAPILASRETLLSPVTLKLLDHRYVRVNANRTRFKYSEGKVRDTYSSDTKDLCYVIYIALDNSNTYPTPFIYPSVKAAQALLGIHDHNIATLSNGFAPSAVVSFNNGIPDSETAEEIEKRVNNKFCGTKNAGRVMVTFSKNKDSAPTVTTIPQTQFAAQFDALLKSSKEQIFANFRCTPSLVGITEDMNSGFNANEYKSQLVLFHRFTCQPIQNIIKEEFSKNSLEVPELIDYSLEVMPE